MAKNLWLKCSKHQKSYFPGETWTPYLCMFNKYNVLSDCITIEWCKCAVLSRKIEL